MSMALSVRTTDVFKNPIPQGMMDIIFHNPFDLFNQKPVLVHRSICETDEDYLQIIPYITLFDNDNCDIFIYQRGQASAEKRLTGKCSIGLGGHIEVSPDHNRDLFDIIAHEAARELNEEVGLDITTKLTSTIRQKLKTSNCGVIYNRSNEVNRVHVGISIFIGVDRSEIKETEANVVSKGRWMSTNEIDEKVEQGEIDLENWSKLVLGVCTES